MKPEPTKNLKPKLSNKKLREKIREKGIPVALTMYGARRVCRRRFRKEGNIQWAFTEEYGVVILDKITVQAYNYGRKKNNMRILRTRDMNRMCVFRYPKVGFK